MKFNKIVRPFSKSNSRVFVIEFLSTFIAVFLAFWLNNWQEDRSDRNAERDIMEDLYFGMSESSYMMAYNLDKHTEAKSFCGVFRDLVNNKPINQDSIGEYYCMLFEGLIFEVNESGFQGLMSQGLDIVQNDSLRRKISFAYNFYLEMITEMEESEDDNQFYKNYFPQINNMLLKYMEFDEKGKLIQIKQPINLSFQEKQELYSYLWRIEKNRSERIDTYEYYINVYETLRSSVKDEIIKCFY